MFPVPRSPRFPLSLQWSRDPSDPRFCDLALWRCRCFRDLAMSRVPAFVSSRIPSFRVRHVAVFTILI
eukprot:4083438-Alexandrium_andersonii.AAC.1